MSKPVMQHIIPRVYLKEFQIDTTSNKSCVYCLDFSNQYNSEIQKVGLNDRVFKEKKYYNDSGYTDPFTIEKMFASEVEPLYDLIMQNIKEESNLSEQVREHILVWTFVSQCRGQYLRRNTERVMTEIIKFQNLYNKKHLNVEQQLQLDAYIKQTSKDIQLGIFSDNEQLEKLSTLHSETLTSKHWRILMAPQGHHFLTNDNPGFSANMDPRFNVQRPFLPLMELNGDSVMYYVFSPVYCLEIRPFFEGTPLEINALNMEIKYEVIGSEYVDLINQGVVYTKYKLLISHSNKLIERFIPNAPDK